MSQPPGDRPDEKEVAEAIAALGAMLPRFGHDTAMKIVYRAMRKAFPDAGIQMLHTWAAGNAADFATFRTNIVPDAVIAIIESQKHRPEPRRPPNTAAGSPPPPRTKQGG
jgi:hypothetical protein